MVYENRDSVYNLYVTHNSCRGYPAILNYLSIMCSYCLYKIGLEVPKDIINILSPECLSEQLFEYRKRYMY